MSHQLVDSDNTPIPSFNVTVSLLPAYEAEENEQLPGPALAETLRRIADDIEMDVAAVPRPESAEWTAQTHTIRYNGQPIGAYHLHQV